MTNPLLYKVLSLPKTNKSGGAHAQGDVCVEDSTNANAVVNNSDGSYKDSAIWVCVEPNGVEDDAKGQYACVGYVPKVNLESSAALGDLIKTFTVDTQATPHAPPFESGDFGQVLETGATPAAWLLGKPESGGEVNLKTYWEPNAPPASPTSQDDEFNDGSLDGKWSEYDPNTVLTVDENSTYKHLILTCTTRTGFNPTGIYQTIPAGDFTIWTKISIRTLRSANYTIAGIGYWEDPTDITKDLHVWGTSPRSGGPIGGLFYYTDSTSFSAAPIDLGQSQYAPIGLYLRVRRNGTDYFHGWSYDGVSWIEGAASNPSYTPTKMGLLLDNANTGATISASFPFFRYIGSDVGLNGIMPGNAAKILT